MDDFYKAILDNLYDGVYFVDRERRITYWNGGAERITGYKRERVIGSHCFDCLLRHVNEEGTTLCEQACPLEATMQDGEIKEAEIFLHHAEGHRLPVVVRAAPLRDQDGNILGAVEVFSDNSSMLATLKRVNELSVQVAQDALTGTDNRRYIEGKVETCLAEYKQHGLACGIIFFDIDHYKRINDTYGHDAGDLVLKQVARTVQHSIRTTDHVGRWGGDEFCVILLDVDTSQLITSAEKLRMLVEQSEVPYEDTSLHVTISVGATLTLPSDTPETLIKRVDCLLYLSKENGRNQISTDCPPVA